MKYLLVHDSSPCIQLFTPNKLFGLVFMERSVADGTPSLVMNTGSPISSTFSSASRQLAWNSATVIAPMTRFTLQCPVELSSYTLNIVARLTLATVRRYIRRHSDSPAGGSKG